MPGSATAISRARLIPRAWWRFDGPERHLVPLGLVYVNFRGAGPGR
jgi:hypothetical protein